MLTIVGLTHQKWYAPWSASSGSSQLQCRVKPHQQGGEWLETNEEAVNPVRLLLCGLKLFYRIAQAHGYYQHDNPLSSSFTEMAEAAREHFVRDDDGSMRPPNA